MALSPFSREAHLLVSSQKRALNRILSEKMFPIKVVDLNVCNISFKFNENRKDKFSKKYHKLENIFSKVANSG